MIIRASHLRTDGKIFHKIINISSEVIRDFSFLNDFFFNAVLLLSEFSKINVKFISDKTINIKKP